MENKNNLSRFTLAMINILSAILLIAAAITFVVAVVNFFGGNSNEMLMALQCFIYSVSSLSAWIALRVARIVAKAASAYLNKNGFHE